MKKALTTILTVVLSSYALAQVGINTTTPLATLDVMPKNINGTSAEGIIPPRMTGDQLQLAENLYSAAQNGIIIYITAPVTTPTVKTAGITSAGLYTYNGASFQKMAVDNGTINTLSKGDVKSSMRGADHSGWYLMDGRDLSSLPAAVQASAVALGFTTSLPDARDKVLKGTALTETVGSTGGSNSLTLLKENLPNIIMTGSVTGNTSAGGQHDHAADEGNGFLLGGTVINNTGTGNYVGVDGSVSAISTAWGGVGLRNLTAKAGLHQHDISNGVAQVPMGGSGVQMDNRSAYMAMNTFIYLGQ